MASRQEPLRRDDPVELNDIWQQGAETLPPELDRREVPPRFARLVRPTTTPWAQIEYLVTDLLFLSLDAVLAFYIRSVLWTYSAGVHIVRLPPEALQEYAAFFFVYAAITILSCQSYGLYRPRRGPTVHDEILTVAKAILLCTVIIAASVRVSGAYIVSRLVVVIAGALNVVTFTAWRVWDRYNCRRRMQAGTSTRNVVIIGTGQPGLELARCLKRNLHWGYAVCGFVDGAAGTPHVLGTVEQLADIVRAHFVDELIVTPPFTHELISKVHAEGQRLKIGVRVIPDIYDGLVRSAPLEFFEEFPVFTVHRETQPRLALLLKRLLDVAVSSVLLIASAPLLAAIALAVKVDSHGPVLYCADRLGRKGRPFRCYKIRTMVANADQLKDQLRSRNERQSVTFKISNDPRQTRVGKILRKYSLDELPQLWNVLKGDMSLVGPRPHPLDDCKQYQLEHLRRLDVTPGITGLWQISARRDPSWEKSLSLDFAYIDRWSLWMDLRILLKTLPAVLAGRGE